MATTEQSMREWARKRCNQWNWNCNVAEIARELIDADITADSDQFDILAQEFVEFFGGGDVSSLRRDEMRSEAENHIHIIADIVREFGG